MNQFRIRKGTPLPLGVTKEGESIRFAIAAPNCEECKLILLHKRNRKKNQTVLIPNEYRTGNVYAFIIEDLPYNEYEYIYEIDGQNVVDPYAKVIKGRDKWGNYSHYFEKYSVRGGFNFDTFDWQEDATLEIPYKDLIIYKMHVRGFTKHSSSKLGKAAGTFKGVTEKISYLKELGVNAVLLMPIVEFDEILIEENYMYSSGKQDKKEVKEYEFVNIAREADNDSETILPDKYREVAKQEEKARIPYRINYWGYSKDNYYFAPKASYAYEPANAVNELKTMVKELHNAGIEVLMEFNFSSSLTQQTILDCLYYWFFTYHIDGFSVNANVVSTSILASDPVLSHTKFFATSWEVSSSSTEGLGKPYRNLAEYNDGFLVDARRYLKSDEEQVSAFANRVRRNPANNAVINYMTNNNGFTLMDLVCYDVKHNSANGEENKDGTDYNYSWNCGTEGKSGKKKIKELRRQQIRNAFVMLLLSQGTPMIMMGDEFGNSQGGNNNAYCQDNAISWLNWNNRKQNEDIESFVKELIQIRKKQGVFGREQEYRMMDYQSCGCPDMSFHGTKAWYPDFSYYSRVFGVMYCGQYASNEEEKSNAYFYVAYNMHWKNHAFDLPQLPVGQHWAVYMDTAITEEKRMGQESRSVQVAPRSIVVLRSEIVKEKANGHIRVKGNSNSRHVT
ncbi:alpha-amylase family glycosyl hydrolase [Anaerosporobacter sp.]|uniref:alpha-amylase family glycosyl hydrolase n=1 Tax=Anaerosporobacter sp. TaxID=1872529 RepID=UPI00286F5A71|nr:alpha-amylase family glycosyl hydrolase [Anaerosporobacter sp.]